MQPSWKNIFTFRKIPGVEEKDAKAVALFIPQWKYKGIYINGFLNLNETKWRSIVEPLFLRLMTLLVLKDQFKNWETPNMWILGYLWIQRYSYDQRKYVK